MTEPAHAPAFLYVERGPGQGQLVPLVDGALVIGRSSTADFRLQHPSISRRHAQLLRKEDRFFLKDFQSQNGTFLNKVRVTREVEIFPGDQIAVGTALMKLRGPNGALEPVPTSPELPAAGRSLVLKSRTFTLVAVAAAFAFGLAIRLAFAIAGMSSTPPPAAPVAQAKQAAPTPTLAPKAPPATAAPAPQTSVEPAPLAKASVKPTRKPAPAKVAPATASVAPVAPKESAPELSPDLQPIRSKYEGGNVQGALDLARKAHANDLIPKLVRFRASYDAAQRAILTHDASATKHVQEALKLDEQIAEGWGTYNAELKSQLTSLRARSVAPKPTESTRGPAARSSAEDAWDDGTSAPAHNAAPAKTKKAAIDAAWGD